MSITIVSPERLRAFGWLLFIANTITLALAAPVPASIFGDRMVLQRDRPIPVWGMAPPGENVSVSLNTGARASAVADAQGRWMVHLPAMPAGGPFEVKIEGAGDPVILHDVLIGDVWLLSGQSNMTFGLSGAANAAEALVTSDRPDVRLITIPLDTQLQPQTGFHAAWQQCSRASAESFTAVGYFFGIALSEKLRVPIGLIHSSWPGTQAEEWTASDALQRDPDFAPILTRWQEAPDSVKSAAGPGFPFSLEITDIQLRQRNGQLVPISHLAQGSIASAFGGAWSYNRDAAPLTSWKLVPDSAGGFIAQVSGRLRDQDGSALLLQLAAGGRPVDLTGYTGVQFRMRGSGFFAFQAIEPAVQDYSNYSSDVLKGSDAWQTIDLPFAGLKQPGWGFQKPWTQDAITGLQIVAMAGDPQQEQRPPSGLFNAMIAPLAPFAMRGVLWYQGEGNAGRAYQYRKLLPAMMNSWRAALQQPDLPFLIVQLTSWMPTAAEPQDSAWAELREAQAIAARTPNAALVVTIDLGDPKNLHPPDKADVGQRAALAAEATVYGQDVAWSGPVYESSEIKADQIVLRFASKTAALRTADSQPLRGFSIAGDDHKFVWADARIENDTIVISSPQVPHPLAVRYDWADSPDGNLTNSTGIPASPFRTDDWPGITINSR